MPVNFPKGDPRRGLRALEAAIRGGTAEATRAAVLATEALAKKSVTDLDAVDRGLLRASIASKTTETPAGADGVVYVGAAYGRWVEYGRAGTLKDPRTDKKLGATAAFPPVSAILAWVKRQYKKLAPSGRTKSGKARRPADADAKAAAFLIGRKIHRFGIKPRPFLGPAFARVMKMYPRLVYDATAKRIAAIKR